MHIQHPLLYLDPGSGSILFQVVLSGLLTLLVFFKRGLHFIRHLLSIRRHKKHP
jgi:hypothetical protein